MVLALIFCALAFVAHYKNWIKLENDRLEILSGIYYKELPYAVIDSVLMVDKIPSMERINGFSAWKTEKGIFKDSLRIHNNVYVYVDNLRHSKIKLVYQDSLHMFFNFKDSIETKQLYDFLQLKIKTREEQFSEKK